MANILACLVLSLTCVYSVAQLSTQLKWPVDQLSTLIRWRPGRCPELKYRCTRQDCNSWCVSLHHRLGICIPINVPCNNFFSVLHYQCQCFGPPTNTAEAPATNKDSAALATSTPQPVSQTSTLAPPKQSTPQITEIERTLTPGPIYSTIEGSTATYSTSATSAQLTPSLQASSASLALIELSATSTVDASSTSLALIELSATSTVDASSTSLALIELSATSTVYGAASETPIISTMPSSAVTGNVEVSSRATAISQGAASPSPVTSTAVNTP